MSFEIPYWALCVFLTAVVWIVWLLHRDHYDPYGFGAFFRGIASVFATLVIWLAYFAGLAVF